MSKTSKGGGEMEAARRRRSRRDWTKVRRGTTWAKRAKRAGQAGRNGCDGFKISGQGRHGDNEDKLDMFMTANDKIKAS